MKLKLFKKFLFKEAIFPWILILIGVILSYQNYSPSTYLSGWDTIHPEFNMGDYFKRILSVWQQHQGLGAVAAQAHASELPRMIIYFLLSLFLPPEVLRYVFLFICLIIGPLGVYFFIKKVVLEHQENYLSKEIISFLGGLLYLLNLATLQLFFVPLEMFEIHYATLGWIFLFATRYIQTSRKKYLFLFIPTIILSGSMAHTPTLFYIFFLIFFIYLTTFIFYNRAFFKKSLLIVLLTILLNLYWILPNLYFVKNYGGDVTNSKIHSEFSDRAFQVGRNFGNIRDSALLKNFLFDWGQYDGKTGSFFLLLGDWETHLKNPRVSLIGIVIFLFVLIGLIYGLRRRNKIAFSFLPVFLITFFFIANDNPLFVGITTFLEKISPVIKETLRFPFTKFSILLLFSFCVYFSLGIYFLINLFKNNLYSKLAILLTFSILLIYFMLPVFKGNLFDPKLKVKIPSEYFQTFKYFDTQDPNSRVASFPVNSFWGWNYYKWGYEGAGFLWFGLRQPILDREFDRWNPLNENFYWEISYATYSQDLNLFEKVLNKYQVDWLLIDENIIDPSSAKSTYFDQFEKMISQSSGITIDNQFGNIKIYKVENKVASKDFITILDSLPIISPAYKKSEIDQAYLQNGDYISGKDLSLDSQVFYPFRSLFSNYRQNNLDSFIDENENSIIFKARVPDAFSDFFLVEPLEDSSKSNSKPTLGFSGKELFVEIPKETNSYTQIINPVTRKLNSRNCDTLRPPGISDGQVSQQVMEENGRFFTRIFSKHANNCGIEFFLPDLPHNLGYLISIESRNIDGKSLLFIIGNADVGKSEMETFLTEDKNWTKSYFIKSPLDEFGLNYHLYFHNWSFNQNQSINDLGEVSIYPIPYNFLSEIFLQKGNITNGKLNPTNFSVSHPSFSLYNVKINGEFQKGNDTSLILYQSFDTGWVALSREGLIVKKVLPHILINNWANGWKVDLDEDKNINIIFLPSILQYIGFAVLVATLYLVFYHQLMEILRKLLRKSSKFI